MLWKQLRFTERIKLPKTEANFCNWRNGAVLIIYETYSEVVLSSKILKDAGRVQYAMFSEADDPGFSG